MAIPYSLLPTTCDIYRPFGSASPVTSGVPCRLFPALARGRPMFSNALMWTHTLDMNPEIDIRDNCSRSLGDDSILYSDGDEVRVPGGSSSRFVVVWVEKVNLGTSREYKRVYLIRHVA